MMGDQIALLCRWLCWRTGLSTHRRKDHPDFLFLERRVGVAGLPFSLFIRIYSLWREISVFLILNWCLTWQPKSASIQRNLLKLFAGEWMEPRLRQTSPHVPSLIVITKGFSMYNKYVLTIGSHHLDSSPLGPGAHLLLDDQSWLTFCSRMKNTRRLNLTPSEASRKTINDLGIPSGGIYV